MEQRKPHQTTRVKHQKVSFCCVAKRKADKERFTKTDNLSNGKEHPLIPITKKKKYHILTSVGSNLELRENVDTPRHQTASLISFPLCEDLRGHFVETLEENHCTELDTSPLYGVTRNSDNISDISSITLKDILDLCETSSTGTPTFTDKPFYNLISLTRQQSKNRRSNYSASPELTPLHFWKTEESETDGAIVEHNLSTYVEKEKRSKYSTSDDESRDRMYDIIESITLQPIGQGVTSLMASSFIRSQSRNEQSEPTSPIIIPLPMPPLPDIPKESDRYQYSNSPSILCRARYQSECVGRLSQGFDPCLSSTKSDNEDPYQDIDFDYSKAFNQHAKITYLKPGDHCIKPLPPSTLIQNLNKTNLKRSSSAEISRFTHLPTKMSESTVILPKLLPDRVKITNTDQSFNGTRELPNKI